MKKDRLNRFGGKRRVISTRNKRLQVETLEARTLLAGHTCDGVPAQPIPGDIDGDWTVAFGDFLILSENFEEAVDSGTNGDIDGDGTVAFEDFLILSENFGLSECPDLISLPVGFESEGITLGQGPEFFVGGFSFSSVFGPLFEIQHPESNYGGAIYKGNLVTGEGEILVEPTENLLIGGLSYDARTDYIYAVTKDAVEFPVPTPGDGVSIYDGTTGDLIERAVFAVGGLVINDVLVTNNAVYATDSLSTTLYKRPLGSDGQPSGDWETITMDGFEMIDGEFNANGLVGEFDGNELVVVNTESGKLFRVDAENGVTTDITVEGEQSTFPSGDGLYLRGRTLYVMQNQFSAGEPGKIAVVQLSEDLTVGTFVEDITSDDFANPVSIIGLGDSIYALNSQGFAFIFGDPNVVQSQIVKVQK